MINSGGEGPLYKYNQYLRVTAATVTIFQIELGHDNLGGPCNKRAEKVACIS